MFRNSFQRPSESGIHQGQDGDKIVWVKFKETINENITICFHGFMLKTFQNNELATATIPPELNHLIINPVIDVYSTMSGKKLWGTGKTIKLANPAFKPDTFLIGAPRAGTTFIAKALDQHPSIYMCPLKEPMFFITGSTQHIHEAIKKRTDYDALFRCVHLETKVVMEASVLYLGSGKAHEKIKKFNPNARVIVSLRNPIQAAISLYERNIEGGLYENAPNFSEAWKRSIQGHHDRTISNNYSSLFKLGSQMERLLTIFERKQIHVCIFDELQSSPRKTIEEILVFLGITDHHNFSTHPENGSRYSGDAITYLGQHKFNELKTWFEPEMIKLAPFLKGRELIN